MHIFSTLDHLLTPLSNKKTLLTPAMAPGSIGRPIPDTWSPWLALWDDQGWRQRASSQVEFFLMNKPCDLPHLRWHPICEGIKLWKMTRNKICNIVILHGNSSVVIGWKGKSKKQNPPFRASVVSETEPLCVGNQLQNIFAPTDSKLAMKLFGSKKALMKERVRQKEIGQWIIHPCSSFRCSCVTECF